VFVEGREHYGVNNEKETTKKEEGGGEKKPGPLEDLTKQHRVQGSHEGPKI